MFLYLLQALFLIHGPVPVPGTALQVQVEKKLPRKIAMMERQKCSSIATAELSIEWNIY